MIVCVLLPRFELAVAAGGREALAAGPLALAPETGREPLIGETSAAAEAYGVRAGLRLGEALARCPTLRLVAPDPAGVADAWERVVTRAGGHRRRRRVRPARHRPGSRSAGLRRLHGGSVEGVIAAPPHPRPRVRPGRAHRGRRRRPRRIAAARATLARGARRPPGAVVRRRRLGAAPSRFAALAAAIGPARGRRSRRGRRASPPTSRRCPSRCSARGPRSPRCPRRWSASGSPRSGSSRALPRAALADRFGAAGPLARDLARGKDTPLRPARAVRAAARRCSSCPSRPPARSSSARSACSSTACSPARSGAGARVRAVVLSAALVERRDLAVALTFREALADPRRMRLALTGRLTELPAPADVAAPARRGLRPAERRPALAARRAGRDPARPPARGGPPDPRRRRARTPRCASSPSIPTRACPNAAWRSRRGSRDRRARTPPEPSTGGTAACPRRAAAPVR